MNHSINHWDPLRLPAAQLIGALRVRTLWIAFSLATCTVCDAAITLEFSTDGGNQFSNQAAASVGDSLTLGVYAVESAGDNRLSDQGLSIVGTLGRYNQGLGSVVAKRANPRLALFFRGDPASDAAGTIDLSGIANDFITPVKGDAILIGEFDYRIANAGTTTFAFGDLSSIDDFETPTISGADGLDSELFSIDPIGVPNDRSRTYSFAVTAIPEPSSVTVLLMGTLTVFRRRRRSKESLHRTGSLCRLS